MVTKLNFILQIKSKFFLISIFFLFFITLGIFLFQTKQINEINTLNITTFETNNYDLLECFKLSSMMKKNNHNRVDVVKLDIEGASIEVINDFINENIHPNQIVVEFEYSETDKIIEEEFNNWSKKLKEVITLMKSKDYKCYNLPRYSHLPYSTIEVLFIKNNI